MLLTIGLVLVVLWALGAFIIPVGSGLIHLLLVLALISVGWHFVTNRRVV